MDNKDIFKIEVSLEELKTKVNETLQRNIDSYFKINNIDNYLSESISGIFSKPMDDSRRSRIGKKIEEAIDDSVRSIVYKIMEKKDISDILEKAIEDNLRDPSFTKELAKLKTSQIIAGLQQK